MIKINQRAKKLLFIFFGSLLVVISLTFFSWIHQSYAQKLPPRTTINQVSVGGLTPPEAASKLKTKSPTPEFVVLKTASGSDKIKASILGLDYNYRSAAKQIIDDFKSKPTPTKTLLILYHLIKPIQINQKPTLDQEKLNRFLDQLETKIGKPAQPAHIELERSKDPTSLAFFQAKDGVSIDKTKTFLSFNPDSNPPELTLIFKPQPKKLSQKEIEALKKRARKLVGKEVVLDNVDHEIKIILNDQDLINFLNAPGDWDEILINKKIKEVAKKIDRPPQDAVFEYDPETLVVAKFKPDKPGLVLDQKDLKQKLTTLLTTIESDNKKEEAKQKENTISLKLDVKQAKIKLKDTNNLGINELIGKGESLYYHSILSRVHNVGLAASKVNDIILKPNEEFSFNQAIGEVSAKTGYKSAYIIKNGRTEKGDGGGVCQVSTTLFRAVLDAGLKVTRRVPHSYRVSYYELDHKPGIDATVFSGNTDLRFVNDTPAHILIRSINIPEKRYLRYEIYGTSDGRTTEIVNHKTWGWQPPLPPEYILDPNLPPKTKKQIDWSAAGIKAKFTNVIKDKEGKIIRQDTYASNYKPWSAKYLVGPDTQTNP